LTSFSYLFRSEWKCYTFVFGFWPRYLFLVLDSCWAMARNSNRIYAYKLISADFTEDTIKKKITLTGQRRTTIKTSYVSILRLSSFYLYKLQTIWLLHLYYIVSATPQSNEVELSRKHQAVLVSNWSILSNLLLSNCLAKWIWVITKLPNSKQSSKGKVKTHKCFQLCHGENKLVFNEMMMTFALFYTNTLSWIFILLAHWK
jgi:hypothetical protein